MGGVRARQRMASVLRQLDCHGGGARFAVRCDEGGPDREEASDDDENGALSETQPGRWRIGRRRDKVVAVGGEVGLTVLINVVQPDRASCRWLWPTGCR